jgi:hypothetical protein
MRARLGGRVERNLIVWRVAPTSADGRPRSFRLTWSTDGRLHLTGMPRTVGTQSEATVQGPMEAR